MKSLRLAALDLKMARQALAIAVVPQAWKVFQIQAAYEAEVQKLVAVTGRSDAIDLFADEIAEALKSTTQRCALGLTDEWPSVAAVRVVRTRFCLGDMKLDP